MQEGPEGQNTGGGECSPCRTPSASRTSDVYRTCRGCFNPRWGGEEEARKLEEVRSLLESSPTWQLAQMAVVDGPSTSAEGEPSRKKLHPTVGGKASRKEFLKAGVLKKPWKYCMGTVALNEICQFQKSTELLICSLLTFGLQNCSRNWEIWYALPGACIPDSAGSCRVLSGQPPGRCQPLHNPHEAHHNNP